MNSTVSSALCLLEDQDRGGDAGAVEQVGGQADHRVEQVLLDQLLADRALRPRHGTARRAARSRPRGRVLGSEASRPCAG